MSKLIIGVLPKVELYTNNDPYMDLYMFVNNYPKKVYEAGAIPIGLVLNDGEISVEQLDLCDAFIIPGGTRIDKSYYRVLEYARRTRKPVLGICAGMQSMAIYSTVYDECVKYDVDPMDNEEFRKIYDEVKINTPILYKLPEDNFHFHHSTRDTIEECKHEIKLHDDSLLKSMYEQDIIKGVSYHSYAIQRMGSMFSQSAEASDKVIEGIENKDLLWVGVQYHPEVDEKDGLIKQYVRKIEGRK